MKNRRRIRGTTLVEVIMAATLTVTVLTTAFAAFMVGMQSWIRGQGAIDAQSGSQSAVRTISHQLEEAMAIDVDGGGNSLTYKLPSVDGDGNYILPPTWDGVTRTISLNGSSLVMSDGVSQRTLCTGVVLTDPNSQGGNQAYTIFTPGAGTITRSIAVMVVSQQPGFEGSVMTSRDREEVYLRNIPDLSQ